MIQPVHFLLEGLPPSKKNSRIVNRATGRSFTSKAFRKWYATHGRSIHHFVKPRRGFPLPLATLQITYGMSDLRTHDTDNMTSSVLDLLTGVGVIKDDNWKCVGAPTVNMKYAESPYTEIVISEGNENVKQIIERIVASRSTRRKNPAQQGSDSGSPEEP